MASQIEHDMTSIIRSEESHGSGSGSGDAMIATTSGDTTKQQQQQQQQQQQRQQEKVVVMFRATGDAPLLKRNKFKISASEKFAKVVDFLRKQIQRDTVVRVCACV